VAWGDEDAGDGAGGVGFADPAEDEVEAFADGSGAPIDVPMKADAFADPAAGGSFEPADDGFGLGAGGDDHKPASLAGQSRQTTNLFITS